MIEFYAFDTARCLVQRVVAVSDRLIVMTDGERMAEIEKLDYHIYLGAPRTYIQPDSFFKLLSALESCPDLKLQKTIYNMGQALKRAEIRCDMDRNVYHCTFLLEEKDKDEWSLFITSPSQDTCYYRLLMVCEEFAKGVGRDIIEAAIAAGVDLRANWEIKRLSSNPS